MKVFYSSSLWNKGKGSYGLRQRTNWHFEFAGLKRCIPAVYRFPQGIVFDIITCLDEAGVREYSDKYENLEKQLTPLQRRCVRQEHPYQAVPIKEIWINGKQVDNGYSSSSSMSIPWAMQDDNLMPVRMAYSSVLEGMTCFACERYCVPYPETSSKIQKFLRCLRLTRVKSLKLVTYPVQRFYPLGIQFNMLPDEKHEAIHFSHPITGNDHTLYFQDFELVDMPMRADGVRRLYVMQATYEIDPAMPQGDTLQFNSSIQYTEPEEDRHKSPGGEYKPSAASSIGIIGGASGPTAVFVTRKGKENTVPLGEHGLPLNICFSVPGLNKEDTSHFALDGINVKCCDSKEYNFATSTHAKKVSAK